MMDYQLEFIKQAHSDQRYGKHHYFYHLKQTALVAKEFSRFYPFLAEDEVKLACYGHDIIEDTNGKVTVRELKEQGFSDRTINIIWKVTDAPGNNRKEKKRNTYPKIRGDIEATAVKLCDRIANLRHNLRSSDKRLIKMYREEHAEFKEALRIEGELDKMWETVDQLIQGK